VVAVVTLGPAELTIRLWVADGSAGRAWYQRLFGRPPDFTPLSDDTLCEWIFKPGCWEIHVVEKDDPVPRHGPLRFGVEDIDAYREQVLGLGIAVDAIDELPGVVRWCNFTDP
jgi:glyoxylase I family protein